MPVGRTVDLDVSKNGGFPQQPWVFLLKMIILGCFGGTPIFDEKTHKKSKVYSWLGFIPPFVPMDAMEIYGIL